MTARWACFGLWGPRAREILAPLTPDPLDFGYMRMRELTVGDVPVRALRVTFVGELGWELYCPTEYGAGLWRALWEAGRDARPASPAATARSTRCGSRRATACGRADITADETPFEAGLGFCVRRRQGVHRRRRARRRRGEARRAERRLRCIVLEDPRSVALGNEPVRVDGEIVGRVTSGGYGYTVERSIAYAYLPAEVERRRARSRSTSSASGSPARSRASRCSTRRASACGHRPADTACPWRAARGSRLPIIYC